MNEMPGMYQASPIPCPPISELCSISEKWGLELSGEEMVEVKAVLEGFLESYRRADDGVVMEPTDLVPREPRLPGYLPSAQENPLGAWAWKCHIESERNGRGLLAGKRIALKDNICVAGMPMRNGSRILYGYVADEDATIVGRILKEGGIIAGKATCEDLCLSGGSYSCASGPVRNPLNPALQTGGSSSGSAALVAAKEVDMAIACDQGGSIRIPACWCGVVGFKPTHGLVPYTGIFSMEPTLDHAGPIAKNVLDAAILLSAIAGKDGLDARQQTAPSYPVDASYHRSVGNLTVDSAKKLLSGLKLGLVDEGFGGNNESVVDAAVKNAVYRASELAAGIVVENVSIPAHKVGGDVWTLIGAQGILQTHFESGGQNVGSRNHHCSTSMMNATFRGLRSNPETLSITNKIFILLAEVVKAKYGNSYYGKGQNLARTLTAAYDAALDKYDVLLMPTLPNMATNIPPAGASVVDRVLASLNMISNTATFDVTGHPALTIPVQADQRGGIGLMIIGKQWEDEKVLLIGRALELLLTVA